MNTIENKKPILTSEEQIRVRKIYKTLPDGLKKVGLACENAINVLMEKGYSYKDAENMVLTVLEESKPYLKQKMYASTIKSIEMIFS
jgi:hypothetical protein